MVNLSVALLTRSEVIQLLDLAALVHTNYPAALYIYLKILVLKGSGRY